MFKIERGGAAALLKIVAALRKKVKKTLDDLHVAAVSVLDHAARTGDVRPLNDFFKMLALNVNWQTSFKLYVQRIQKDAKLAFLDFEKGEFKQKENVETQKKAFSEYAEACLINPDGEDVTRFYERDLRAELKIFSNEDLLSELQKLVKRAQRDDERIKSEVDDKVLAQLTKTVDYVESVVVH